jgi:hypothetical protein
MTYLRPAYHQRKDNSMISPVSSNPGSPTTIYSWTPVVAGTYNISYTVNFSNSSETVSYIGVSLKVGATIVSTAYTQLPLTTSGRVASCSGQKVVAITSPGSEAIALVAFVSNGSATSIVGNGAYLTCQFIRSPY